MKEEWRSPTPLHHRASTAFRFRSRRPADTSCDRGQKQPIACWEREPRSPSQEKDPSLDSHRSRDRRSIAKLQLRSGYSFRGQQIQYPTKVAPLPRILSSRHGKGPHQGEHDRRRERLCSGMHPPEHIPSPLQCSARTKKDEFFRSSGEQHPLGKLSGADSREETFVPVGSPQACPGPMRSTQATYTTKGRGAIDDAEISWYAGLPDRREIMTL